MTDQMRDAWSSLDVTRRFAVVAAVTVGLGLVAYFVLSNRAPEYKPLFVHIDAREAGAVTQKLHELKVPYQLLNDGETILVPASQLYQTRLEMASAGLLQKGTAGFDLFDKVRLQTSALSEKVLYQRALQGELAATIQSIEDVESARVNLVLPRQEMFLDDQRSTTAAVVLKMRAGKRLERKQVEAVRALVVGSVEGIKPEGVTIMDTHGDVLTTNSEESQAGGASTLLELQHNQERYIEQHVGQLLERIVGPGQAMVRASVQLDSEQKSVDNDQYVPTDKTNGIVRSTQSTDELYRGAASPGPAAAPSTDAASPAPAAPPSPSAVGGTYPNYNHRVTTTNYEISRRQEKITTRAGAVKHISVAVALSSKVKLTPSALQDLQQLVNEAAGLDKSRNDTLHVSYVEFHEPDATAETEEMKSEARERRWFEWARLGIPLVSVLLFWFMAGRLMRRATAPAPRRVDVRLTEARPTSAVAETEAAPALPTAMAERALPVVEASASSAANDAWDEMRAGLQAAMPTSPATTATSEVTELARKAALEKPSATVSLLEKWVSNNAGERK